MVFEASTNDGARAHFQLIHLFLILAFNITGMSLTLSVTRLIIRRMHKKTICSQRSTIIRVDSGQIRDDLCVSSSAVSNLSSDLCINRQPATKRKIVDD